MNKISASGKIESSIYNLYKNMNLSSAVDSDNLALSWLEKHGKTFFGYVDGCCMSKEKIEKEVNSEMECHKVCDNFTGKHLCDIYASVDKNLFFYAAKNSASGFETWSSQTPMYRSQILHKIALTLEKYQLLFATVEAISSGRHFSTVKRRDVPNLIESFMYYSGCALQLENVSKAWFPIGPVCIVTEEYNNSSMTLSLRVSSVLASGNSVLLLTDVKSSLSSLLLAEICSNSGIPKGVLNVIPVGQGKLEIEELATFSKLIFTGSLKNGLPYSKLSFRANIPYDILIPKRPVIIVYENSDLNSAANGVLEAFFGHDTRSKSSGCKVMIQESISEKFLKVLNGYFEKILVGQNMSKTDMSCIVTEEQKTVLIEYIKKVDKSKKQITDAAYIDNCNYVHLKPILISTLQCNSKLLHEELGGPIIVTVTFRTVKESLAMFNCDNRGSPVSIWTEKISVALEVAQKLKTGIIWVNSETVIDTRIPFSGTFFSGNSVEGGKDALFSHMSVITNEERISDYQNENDAEFKESKKNASLQRKVTNSQFGDEILYTPSNPESDVQNAVSRAVAAQTKWESFTDFQKRKVFIDVMDKLQEAREEFILRLVKVSGSSLEECQEEITETTNLLYYFANQNDKFNIPVQEIKKNFLALQIRNPVGVIGIECSNIKPLLSFVSLVISAITHGNTVVALASERCPIIALKMSEIFSSANIPGGVVNVIRGSKTHLVSALCKHTDVNAIWFSTVPLKDIYADCNVTKKVFYCNKMWTDFNEAKSLKYAMESTYIKSIFLPAGDIFAN